MVAASRIASAITSGWYIGGGGRTARGMCDTACSKNGVLTDGGNTMDTRTALRSPASSARTASVKPRMAHFEPEYADCSGTPRNPIADTTCTTVPALRGAMRRSAVRVPFTVPR